MKIKPIKKTLTATALTDPDPSFVSICKGVGPANQEPFRAIRTEVPATPEEAAPMKMSKAKASSAVAALAQTGFGVMQFQFDKSTFKTAEEVTQWLTDGGYSDFEIVERAKTFEVNDEDGRYEVGSVTPVPEAAPGVKAFVGKISGDEQVTEGEPAAATDTVEKTDETPEAKEAVEKTETVERPEIDPAPRQRAAPAKDEAVAETTEAAPSADATAEGGAAAAAKTDEPVAGADEGVGGATAEQPVATERTDEVVTDETEISAETRAKIDAIVEQAGPTVAKRVSSYDLSYMADVLCCLRYLVLDADYSGFDEATVKSLKAAAKQALDAFVGAAGTFATEYATATKTAAEEPAVVEEAPAAPAATATKTDEAPVDLAALVQKAVADAVAPLNERVERAEKDASEAREEASVARSELAERVAADEARSQSRKAADDLDQVDAPAVKKERCRASTNMLSAFGSRHTRD